MIMYLAVDGPAKYVATRRSLTTPRLRDEKWMDLHKGARELGMAGRNRNPSGKSADTLHMIHMSRTRGS